MTPPDHRPPIPVHASHDLPTGRPESTDDRNAPQLYRVPSIRLRRRSAASVRSVRPEPARPQEAHASAAHDGSLPVRPRSTSEPQAMSQRLYRPQIVPCSARGPSTAAVMPRLTEEGARPSLADLERPLSSNSLPSACPPTDRALRTQTTPHTQNQGGRWLGTRRLSRILRPGQGASVRVAGQENRDAEADTDYNDRLVDWLDMFDPEIQTLSTLTNVQNSLFVPDLGGLVNRRPTYVVSEYEREFQRPSTAGPEPQRREGEEPEQERPGIERTSSISSRLTDSHFAALPHGTTLEGWTVAEKLELEDHVRHMLHSRRSRFMRGLKGFGQYVRTPLGFFVTLYAVLITLFGLAWVLFLIGWIYVGEKQVYTIHIIDSVLVALFAIVGDGMAPLRAIDTYHMIFIIHYYRVVKKADQRKRKNPKTTPRKLDGGYTNEEYMNQKPPTRDGGHELLRPENTGSLPTANVDTETTDLESGNLSEKSSPEDQIEASGLTSKQLKSLSHHQEKLAKSHSFYKAQDTFTHHAFPLGYLIGIIVLLDCHSCLQISLGACTWGIDYHTRPFAITTTILSVSIACNITAGLLISIGDRKTRKKDVIALLDRQELTATAIKHVKKKRGN
ncbi:hypothetical protein jhhlp_006962 [Lomentospora prolificans]|uniref:Integral membrane protein n=1 Tax=Lomentospora prolificans TaxID=41688 RepID=A0A2N3N1A3_9PEZI|nr:hypothetical protein jhhlp_006962 [Lomentospora prolificans]